jgi:hypothetical protein
VKFLSYKDRKRILVRFSRLVALQCLLSFRSPVERGKIDLWHRRRISPFDSSFVGSHLVDRLMLEGHEVIVADNFFTGRKRNIEHWIGHENFELINHDVVHPLFIEGKTKRRTSAHLQTVHLVDQIYHLASPASPPHYMYNPVKTIKVNSIGTINMLGRERRGHIDPCVTVSRRIGSSCPCSTSLRFDQ